MNVRIGHLYPELLNLYGDRGNIFALVCRCRWRNIPVEVVEVHKGERIDLKKFDILLLGGGSDREQHILAKELLAQKENMAAAIADGVVVLAVCGGYQMLGQYYRTPEGEEIPGMGILPHYTVGGRKRIIGDIAIEADLDGEPTVIIGFENHGGRTYRAGAMPLGRVLVGGGNNGEDGSEGIRWLNVFGTYLHGPVLPKNPQLADLLLTLALRRKGWEGRLTPLADEFENRAREVMLKRLGLLKNRTNSKARFSF